MRMVHDTIDSCRVTVINEVLDTRQELELPSTAAEALANCFPVETARAWISLNDMGEPITGPEPIAVSVRKTDKEITVRWYVVGDVEAARIAMADVLSGAWRGGLQL